MRTVLTYVLNFFIGIIGPMFLISSLTTGRGVSSIESGVRVGVGLTMSGTIIWLIVVLGYFFGARKLWGRTVGGLIVDAVMGKKK